MDKRYTHLACTSTIIPRIYNITLCGNVLIFSLGTLDKKCIWCTGIAILYHFLLIITNNIIDIVHVLNNTSNTYTDVVSINVILTCSHISPENHPWVIVYGKKFWFNDYSTKLFFLTAGGFFQTKNLSIPFFFSCLVGKTKPYKKIENTFRIAYYL